MARAFQEATENHWRQWSRRLAIPPEWQDAVIRAAITLKLCQFEETGAIVAAMTTSIPEAPASGRNWDYRYCWLRDAFFVVRALNSLVRRRHDGALPALPRQHRRPGDRRAPAAGLRDRARAPARRTRGRRRLPATAAWDRCASATRPSSTTSTMSTATSCWRPRSRSSTGGCCAPATEQDFLRLERVGEQAWRVYATPDAGMWELRTRERIHTSSALMCWAACDRLARIAAHRGLPERARHWDARAAEIRQAIESHAFDAARGSFMESFGGNDVEAGLLLMAEVGFLPPGDARFAGTVAARRGAPASRAPPVPLRGRGRLRRSRRRPSTSAPSGTSTRWRASAAARRRASCSSTCSPRRNHLGLLSEDIAPDSGEHWGNYPQTYSLVGIVNAAMRLSRGWEAFT